MEINLDILYTVVNLKWTKNKIVKRCHFLDVEEISDESVRLTWTDGSHEDVWTSTGSVNYRVEYNRQNWDIWYGPV